MSGIAIAYSVFWLPWIFISLSKNNSIFNYVDDVPKVNVALVFGGLYRQGQGMSEINRERLLAAKELLLQDKVSKIIVSNTESAAFAMRDFLITQEVSEDKIIADTGAETTLDTCKNAEKGENVIFVSHAYHLPRILYQCGKVGLQGVGFEADSIELADAQSLPWHEKFQIRYVRVQREAFLTMLSVIGIYE